MALATVLGDFLPMMLANVPFSRASTLAAHNACTWVSISMLAYMLVVMVVLLATMFRPGAYGSLPFVLSALSTVAAPAILASGSPELLAKSEGLSTASSAERETVLAGQRYGLAVGYEGDSTMRCGIEIVGREAMPRVGMTEDVASDKMV